MRVANQATLQELAERIDQADAVVIGGGSGLSSAAGYDHYHWSPALSEALAPFREQYGFTSPLAGFYHCFSSYGEQWGYYSQYIRFMWEAPTGQPYLDLQTLVADKPVFVLTKAENGVKGSGRSIEAYSMYEEMVKCGDLLIQFGGHPMSAGLSI